MRDPLTPERIEDLLTGCIKTGIDTGVLPPGYELPARTKDIMRKAVTILRPILDDDHKAAITFCMGFVEGFRHGRGERISVE